MLGKKNRQDRKRLTFLSDATSAPLLVPCRHERQQRQETGLQPPNSSEVYQDICCYPCNDVSSVLGLPVCCILARMRRRARQRRDFGLHCPLSVLRPSNFKPKNSQVSNASLTPRTFVNGPRPSARNLREHSFTNISTHPDSRSPTQRR